MTTSAYQEIMRVMYLMILFDPLSLLSRIVIN